MFLKWVWTVAVAAAAVAAVAVTAVPVNRFGLDEHQTGEEPPAPQEAATAELEALRSQVRSGFTTLEQMVVEEAQAEDPDGEHAEQLEELLDTIAAIGRAVEAEVNRIQADVVDERAASAEREEEQCGPPAMAARIFDSWSKDPDAELGDTVLAALDCRAAYRGIVSKPATDVFDHLRTLCLDARDLIVEHYDDQEKVWDPDRAAIWAIRRCGGYSGAAYQVYTLAGDTSAWSEWVEADQMVSSLTTRFLRGDFRRWV